MSLKTSLRFPSALKHGKVSQRIVSQAPVLSGEEWNAALEKLISLYDSLKISKGKVNYLIYKIKKVYLCIIYTT